MLRVLAARLILIVLSAAPPDFTAPLAHVNPTAPVIVFRLDVVTRTILARLLCDVELALTGPQLPNLLLHLLTFLDKHLLLLFELDLGIEHLRKLFLLFLHVFVVLHDSPLERVGDGGLLPLQFLLLCDQ